MVLHGVIGEYELLKILFRSIVVVGGILFFLQDWLTKKDTEAYFEDMSPLDSHLSSSESDCNMNEEDIACLLYTSRCV